MCCREREYCLGSVVGLMPFCSSVVSGEKAPESRETYYCLAESGWALFRTSDLRFVTGGLNAVLGLFERCCLSDSRKDGLH